MKILVVTQYFWPENFRINDLVKEWNKDNNEVEILTGIPNYPSGVVFEKFKKNKSDFDFYESAKIHRVPMVPRGDGSRFKISINYITFFISALFYAFFKLRKKKYDIIFTFGTSPVTVSLIGIFLSKFTNSKNVIWLLDLWPNILSELKIIKNNFFYKIIKVIVEYIYKKNDIIFAQSKQFIEILSENKKIKKIELLYSWPEQIDFKLGNYSKDINRLPDYLNIVFTGAIGEAQNFEEILVTLKSLKKNKIRMVVIGDGRKKEWVRKYIKKEKLDNIILIDSKPLEKMPEYISHADILFFSLKSGKFGAATIPGKLSTYLKYDKPILCHAAGESNNVVKKNKFGLVSNPGDLIQLKKNIELFQDLKKNNLLNETFNKSSSFLDFDFKNSYSNLKKNLNNLKVEKDKNKLKLIINTNNIPFNENFVLSGLNLAFVGFLKSRDLKISRKTYLWPDGIFAKRFFSQKINKISGRSLIEGLIIPKEKDTIHVIGNLQSNSKIYLEKKFKLLIRHTPLPFASAEELKSQLPKIYENEVVFLTLPTPKQEIIADELSLNNEKYSIFCIGGALNMLGGYESDPPKFIENNFEFLWRLRFDTKRRLKRLLISMTYYLIGEISLEYHKYEWEII